MSVLTVFTTPEVKEVFNNYPDYISDRLFELRELILETATDLDEIVTIEENLKWGEPSYSTPIGSTLRMDWKEKKPNQFSLYFQCTTKLVPTFKAVYKDTFTFEKNRAIVFNLHQPLPIEQLKKCIKACLTYHKVKKLTFIRLIKPQKLDNKTERYQITFDSWNSIAELYREYFMELPVYNDSYTQFCDRLNEDATILELGCGPGNITRFLRNYSKEFNITAIDISPNMIALAKKHVQDVAFLELDCRQLGKLKNKYDAIMCGFTIPYLSKEDVSSLIKDCNSVLHNNGLIYISFVPGDYNNSGFVTGSNGKKMYFYYYNYEFLHSLLTSKNFLYMYEDNINYKRNDNSEEEHTILIYKKMVAKK